MGIATATSATVAGPTQSGDFTEGIFMLLQPRTQKGLTQLSLMDSASAQTACGSVGKGSASEATLAKKLSSKELGILTGTATGMFQIRGTFSAATVRGTSWGVHNQCNGTLTVVRRGMVLVRDFATRKNILLSRGHTYLAKAPAGAQLVSIGKHTNKHKHKHKRKHKRD